MKVKEAMMAWTAIIGAEKTISNLSELIKAQQTTFFSSQNILGILEPSSTSEVQECIKIANRFKVPLYPISKGKNFGLGAKLPVQSNCILLDLSGLNNIVDFDEELAYVTVEPGVSFGQLEAFLQTKNSHLMMDSIGSTSEASIVGNTMERGHGAGMYVDRFNHVCGFEVILADGTIINTGYEGFDNAKVAKLSKWGCGPYLDGLFTQSNLGVVTKLTFWLKPKADYYQTFIFYMNEKQLNPIVDECRKLKLKGLQASIRIFSDYRMMAFSNKYPWKLAEGMTPLQKDARQKYREELGIEGEWVGLGALYSFSKKHALAERELIKKHLSKNVSSLYFYADSDCGIPSTPSKIHQEDLEFLHTKSQFRGYTSEQTFTMLYWRKKMPLPEEADILNDKCGLLWYTPTIPARSEDVLNVINIVKVKSNEFGFEPNLGFLYANDRALDITGAICYDREVEGDDEKALACHNAIMDELIQHGYVPYRLGIQSMHYMNNQQNAKIKLLHQLKKALDPNQILAPGRYLESTINHSVEPPKKRRKNNKTISNVK